VVVNDTGVRRGVEDLSSTISGKIMDTLVNVFVEADNPLQVKCGSALSLVVVVLLFFLVFVLLLFVLVVVTTVLIGHILNS